MPMNTISQETSTNTDGENFLSRIVLRFTAWTEKWMPDAFGFVLVGTIIIFVAGILLGESPVTLSMRQPILVQGNQRIT